MLKLLIGIVTVLGFAGSVFAENPVAAEKKDDTAAVAPAATPSTPKSGEKAVKEEKTAKPHHRGMKKYVPNPKKRDAVKPESAAAPAPTPAPSKP